MTAVAVCFDFRQIKALLLRGLNLISVALRFGRLWYAEPNALSNALSYAKFYSSLAMPTIEQPSRFQSCVPVQNPASTCSL